MNMLIVLDPLWNVPTLCTSQFVLCFCFVFLICIRLAGQTERTLWRRRTSWTRTPAPATRRRGRRRTSWWWNRARTSGPKANAPSERNRYECSVQIKQDAVFFVVKTSFYLFITCLPSNIASYGFKNLQDIVLDSLIITIPVCKIINNTKVLLVCVTFTVLFSTDRSQRCSFEEEETQVASHGSNSLYRSLSCLTCNKSILHGNILTFCPLIFLISLSNVMTSNYCYCYTNSCVDIVTECQCGCIQF